MRGNIMVMKIPCSSSRKSYGHQMVEIKGTAKDIKSLSPKSRNDKLKEYFKRAPSISPIFQPPFPPAHIRGITPKLHHIESNHPSNKSDIMPNSKIRKAKSSSNKKRYTKNSKNPQTHSNISSGILLGPTNNNLESIKVFKDFKNLNRDYSTVIYDEKTIIPHDILNGLKELLISSNIPTPEMQSCIFQKFPPKSGLFPRIKKLSKFIKSN